MSDVISINCVAYASVPRFMIEDALYISCFPLRFFPLSREWMFKEQRTFFERQIFREWYSFFFDEKRTLSFVIARCDREMIRMILFDHCRACILHEIVTFLTQFHVLEASRGAWNIYRAYIIGDCSFDAVRLNLIFIRVLELSVGFNIFSGDNDLLTMDIARLVAFGVAAPRPNWQGVNEEFMPALVYFEYMNAWLRFVMI